MGGNAYILDVAPDPQRHILPFLEAERNKKRGLLARLFGSGESFSGLADLPPGSLGEQLLGSFYSWADAKTENPAPATAAFIKDYLHPIKAGVYLRGERTNPEKPEEFSCWYVQMSFSGCAGMGEVSSALACHWADIWIRENLDMIDNDILAPNGLARKDSPQSVDYGLFFPFGSRGYALYYPKGAETELYIDDREIKVNFELDAAVEESIIDEEGLKAFHAEALSLQENLPEELEEGKCLCQMCHH